MGGLASGTAHPASALAFRRARVVSFVITHLLHQHALAHGLEIARKDRMVDSRPTTVVAPGTPRSNMYDCLSHTLDAGDALSVCARLTHSSL